MKEEEKTSDGTDDADRIKRYKEEIAYYEKESGPWSERVRKILRRYKDERSPREQKIPRFNILYSNISTLLPAVYGRNPKPDIERRFKDDDPLGRVSSEVLERCCDFFVQTEAFRSSMRNALFDRLMGGRGIVWTRYVPHFSPMDEEEDEGEEITNDIAELSASEDEPNEEVSFEEAITDYVHWDDFGHNWGRTYDELYLMWRKVYLTKKELKARFKNLTPEQLGQIPLDYHPKGLNDQKKDTALKKTVIYEIWDDTEKRVCWLHKDAGINFFLDDKDDPLQLPDFFPAPKPLYGVLANDSLIPVPDYVEYQDQANELDELTSRIASITKSVKVVGVYDASAPGIERLLAEGVENKLIPVSQWAIFAEKGGIAGAISMLPVKDIMETLLGLYEAREKVKADLYEITGIADIIRGNNDPRSTATAEKIKSNFATIRLSDTQDDMARFSRDAVKNVCIIIANHFSLDTIKKISGMKLLTTQEKQQILMQQAQAKQQYAQAMQLFQAHQQMSQQMPQGAQGQPGQAPNPSPAVQPPPAPPPIPDDLQELLDNPTWEEIDALFKDEAALSFKIDIEVDSTIKMDEQEDKAARVEFLESSAKFITAGIEAGTQEPALMPLFAQMLMFGVRGFRVGKDMEGQFRVAMEKLEKAAANPQPKQNPEMLKAQADIQAQEARAAADKQDAENDAKMKILTMQQEAQLKSRELQQQYELKMKEMQMEFDFKMREMQADNDVEMKKHRMTTEASQKPAVNLSVDGMDKFLGDAAKQIGSVTDTLAQQHKEHTKAVGDALGAIAQHHAKPKTITMRRADGSTMTAQVQ